jgi:hypothetical protein
MVGQFKDDRYASHTHQLVRGGGTTVGASYTDGNNSLFAPGLSGSVTWGNNVNVSTSGSGTTTRTKQKGVTYIVKVL